MRDQLTVQLVELVSPFEALVLNQILYGFYFSAAWPASFQPPGLGRSDVDMDVWTRGHAGQKTVSIWIGRQTAKKTSILAGASRLGRFFGADG